KNAAEIEWDPDLRLVARLLDQKADVFALRGRQQLPVFRWEEIPGSGVEGLRSFLVDDYLHGEHFAHVIYESLNDIERAEINRDTARNAIQIVSASQCLEIRLKGDRASVVLLDGAGEEHDLHDFFVQTESGQHVVFVSARLDLLNCCARIRALLGPLIFERQAHYEDGYLFDKAVTMQARHLI